jgi:hypothetical protein
LGEIRGGKKAEGDGTQNLNDTLFFLNSPALTFDFPHARLCLARLGEKFGYSGSLAR